MTPPLGAPQEERCVLPDPEGVSREAAERFVALAQRCAQASGRCLLALAGGASPRGLYARLASEPFRRRVPWERVQVFWSDERCVPPEHPASNFGMARDLLLSRVPLPAANIHRILAEQGAPEAVARSYERELQECFHVADGDWPSFDLMLLGLGADGHAASLFPRSAALQELRRWVTSTTGGHPPLPRVTLTLPVLNAAKHLIWLVTGSQKASATRAVLEGPERLDDVPAQRIRLRSGVSVWLMDRAASSLLRPRATEPGQPRGSATDVSSRAADQPTGRTAT